MELIKEEKNEKYSQSIGFTLRLRLFHTDRVQESGTGGILSNVCATLAAQLFIDILCDSHRHLYCQHGRARRHAGWLVGLPLSLYTYIARATRLDVII